MQRGELRAAAIFGLIIAIAIDIGWLFTLFPYMDPNVWRWPIAVLTCVIQTIVTTGGIILAARLHKRLRVNIWFAIPYGVVSGALVGAVSLGLAIGFRTLLGMRTGMIVMVQEAEFLNTASAIRQFMEGFGAGVAFGMVGGFIPGAAGSLALSMWRRRQEQHSVSA
ncbi:MAG: hypothetical protein HZB50_00955 [Chloroflexi bacterium]|nr:hypothetical protein [Chloroflexota bacterium]